MIRILRHNAIKGYQTYTISQESLTNYTQDIPKISRYHYITNDQFDEILKENTISIKKQLSTKYGLRL